MSAAQTASAPAAADIRDIRPPYPLSQQQLWIIAAALAAVAVVALAWWWWRRSRGSARTLLERTLERLERTRALMRAGDVEGFAVAVSEIVRGYVEQRFEIRALHRTTLEFLRDCLEAAGSPLRAYQQTLAEFLSCCDLAKFARWSPSGTEMEALLASAREFVRYTSAPTPPAAAGRHGGGGGSAGSRSGDGDAGGGAGSARGDAPQAAAAATPVRSG